MTFKHIKIILMLSALWSCKNDKKVAHQTVEATPVVHGALMRQGDINIKPITKKALIKLDNPSFEDIPEVGHTPIGWHDCGFENETPPDVQPNMAFKVTQTANHGSTYLALVTRDVNTWERVGQKLKSPLEKGMCYSFCINLMRSPLYESQSQLTLKTTSYTTPVILKVWGGNATCEKKELLAESPKIEETAWKKYCVTIKPKDTLDHIFFEAYFDSPSATPYNGNLLLDNLSALIPCVCDTLSR